MLAKPPLTQPLSGLPAWPLYGTGAVLYLGTLVLGARRVTADGYDGVGFVLALSQLDLTRWQPQPPGYPLLVVFGRALCLLGLPPALALAVVNAVLLAAGLGVLAWGIRQLAGPWAGRLAALLLPVAPLSFALALSTLSDAAGLGALLLAAGPLLRPQFPSTNRLLLSGVGAGLALGIRPAYVPLFGLLLLVLAWHAGWRAAARVAVAAALTSLVWLLPLAVVVGPHALWSLSTEHVNRHFEYFGGALPGDREPSARLGTLIVTCVLGAVGPLWPLWIVAPALALWPSRRNPDLPGQKRHDPLSRLRERAGVRDMASTQLGNDSDEARCLTCPSPNLSRKRERGRLALSLQDVSGTHRVAGSLLVLLLGGGLWVFVALPAHGHGRHVLPLAVAALALLAVVLGTALTALDEGSRRRAALSLLTAIGLMAHIGYGIRTAWAFRTNPAPGAALADYVASNFPVGTVLYGARAARHLDARLGSGSARPAQSLGEVIADIPTLTPPPPLVLLTSEVRATAAAAALLHPRQRFCYDDAVPRWLRLDHFEQDCVTLFDYRVSP